MTDAAEGKTGRTTFPESYLGDGVYASFDGYHFWLDLRAQDNTRIALDPYVIEAFDLYRKSIDKALDQLRETK